MFNSIIFAVAGCLVFCCGFGSGDQDAGDEDLLSDKFIENINSVQHYWTAGRNFEKNTSLSYFKGLTGVHKHPGFFTKLDQLWPYTDGAIGLPEHFDAREQWPDCPTVGEIVMQRSCGSCWAYAAVEVMSDRVCIHSKGAKTVRLSAENLLSCCWSCSNGCNGGNPGAAWRFWKTEGIVSGGPYGSDMGCISYEISPYDTNVNGKRKFQCHRYVKTTQCDKKCQDGYKIPYAQDLHRGDFVYSIANDADQIRRDIYTNGPVAGTFNIYEDFLAYKDGIYKHVSGRYIGNHAVKILGWGVNDDGIPYWLVANSWGSNWGKNGFFKILRGSDECGIEKQINAGLPA